MVTRERKLEFGVTSSVQHASPSNQFRNASNNNSASDENVINTSTTCVDDNQYTPVAEDDARFPEELIVLVRTDLPLRAGRVHVLVVITANGRLLAHRRWTADVC